MWNSSSPVARQRAFTLVELLVVIAIIALLVSILLPALVGARKTARQAQNGANLKQLVTAIHNYGGDFRDRIAAFTARGGVPIPYVNEQGVSSMITVGAGADLLAAANQAISIIRRRSSPVNYGITTSLNDWIPHPTYSHLVLMDFLSARMPEPMLLNPIDRYRQDMADRLRVAPDPAAFCNSLPGTNGGVRSTWAYSSSYQMVPASYMPDKEGVNGEFLHQAGDQIYYQFSGSARWRLGDRKLSEVMYPAQKVVLMEDVGRLDSKLEHPWIHPNSTFAIAAFDGQVRTLKGREVNPGAYTRPNGRATRVFLDYTEQTAWGYPLWPGGSPIPSLPGTCRWTYRGLKGIDFGGAEPADAAW